MESVEDIIITVVVGGDDSVGVVLGVWGLWPQYGVLMEVEEWRH